MRWLFIPSLSQFLFAMIALSACGQSELVKPSVTTTKNSEALSREAALTRVLAMHPRLASYRDGDGLPPKDIAAEPGPADTWRFAFVAYGSGRPGIIHAECYVVDRTGHVTATGTFRNTGHDTIDSLRPSDCQPAPARR